jgi:Flp pilus assembly protein TadD
MFSNARSIALAGSLALAGATLIGCQSGNNRADAFGAGGDRPPTPRTLHMMAKLINENGRTDQAEFVLTQIIDESPEYLPAYVELADIYIGAGRFAEARDTLRMARVVAPDDAVLANNLGVLLLREGTFAEASESFHAAVEHDPSEARYHANLAVSYAMAGKFNEAFAAWAMVLPPEEVFWNLAVVAEAQGNAQSASQFFADANRARSNANQQGLEFRYNNQPQTATVSVPVE